MTQPSTSPDDARRGRALVITPTYNERDNLTALVERFFSIDQDVDLLVVDDESPDGTADLCDALVPRFPRLGLLRRRGPRGLGRAYLAGFEHGLTYGYEIIGTMDADLSHSPDHLPSLLDAVGSGAGVAIGCRYMRDGGTVNWGLRRMALSWLANRFAAALLRIPARDVTSGFRLYRAETLRQLGLEEIRSTGYSFLVEILYRAHLRGVRIAERPIVFFDRRMGASKLHQREIWIGAMRVLGLRLFPPRMAGD